MTWLLDLPVGLSRILLLPGVVRVRRPVQGQTCERVGVDGAAVASGRGTYSLARQAA